MSNWHECQLGDIAEIQTGPFGSQLKNEQYITGGTPVITVEHINNFRINDFNYPSVTEKDKNRLSRYLLNAGDIIFTRVGSVDLSAYVKPHQQGWMFSSRMLRVRPNKSIDSRFLSYFFQQKSFRDHVLSIAVGATMPSINTEILKSLPVSFPNISEQNKIGLILSSLDDKIDVLNRQNKTLETMAETLFRQWFAEEAADDWDTYKVSDFAEHLKNSIAPAKNQKIAFHHYSLPAFDAGMKAVIEFGSEILSNKYKIEPWTILVSKLNPRFPRIWPIGNKIDENSICSTEFQVFKPINEKLYGYLYFLFKSNDAREELTMSASGTSGSHQRVRPEDILNIRTSLPSIKMAEKYSNMVMPGIKKSIENRRQIQLLENIRDGLLQKLMNREVII